MARRPARVSVVTQPGWTQLTAAVEAKPWISTTGSPSPSSRKAMLTPSCRKLCIRWEAAERSGPRRHGGEAQPLAREPRAAALAIALGGALGRALDRGEEAPHQHHRGEQPGEQRERARAE